MVNSEVTVRGCSYVGLSLCCMLGSVLPRHDECSRKRGWGEREGAR